jgi:hypothetical protein
MRNDFDLVAQLTQPTLPASQRRIALREFARATGWRPSYELEYPELDAVANGHLVVEHGLDNTAVLTFLKAGTSYSSLALDDRLRLLAISYNNLVDWHFFPQPDRLILVYNRNDPPAESHFLLSQTRDAWRAEAFDRIVGRRPNPNLKSLDRALIETISFWKRSLAAELGQDVKLDNISALFNALIFVRALEDDRRHQAPNTQRVLLDIWSNAAQPPATLAACIQSCMARLGAVNLPPDLLDLIHLAAFDNLDRETVDWLLRDFYDIRSTPYKYDFSLMSKHALSRIYERYVSLLRSPSSDQMTLFPELPDEVRDRRFGGVYTPQYIARFFARFLQENLTPPVFRNLRTSDPACGSGIFLRTLLELQCDPIQYGDIQATVRAAFGNILGIDIDPNACQATKLSLYLLHLVLTGVFPEGLKVECTEALGYYQAHPELSESQDAVIANPPFIKWDHMAADMQHRVVSFVGEDASGKVDMFLAHLKLGLQMIKPGGFLLYVLPHSFLLAKNAASLRRKIAATCWVRFLADLSQIPVFEDVGSYVILLVLQKKAQYLTEQPQATVVRCADLVGQALEDALEGKRSSTDFYTIYDVDQSAFKESEWNVLPPAQSELNRKLQHFSRLDAYLTIREGFVSGADDIFILQRDLVPPGEEEVYKPFLSDREMERYALPAQTSRVVFYPYLDGAKLETAELQRRFRQTWRYLESHQQALKHRAAVTKSQIPWWCPERPRSPENMFRPKLVSPHLILRRLFKISPQIHTGTDVRRLSNAA